MCSAIIIFYTHDKSVKMSLSDVSVTWGLEIEHKNATNRGFEIGPSPMVLCVGVEILKLIAGDSMEDG